MHLQPAGHEPELLTIAEAAQLLRTPVATLRYWRHRNTGPRSGAPRQGPMRLQGQ
jgi:hypothetical protein